MEKPSQSAGKAKAVKETDEKENRMSVAVEAERRQEQEMRRIPLGACLGRTDYREAWKEIGGLEIIQRGISLRWNWWGPPAGHGEKRATVRNKKEKLAYRQQLEEMLKEKIVVEREQSAIKFFNHTFLIKKTETEYRFILNARQLNQHLIVRHFKLENIGTVLETVRQGDLLIKFDLKSAYSQVPLAASAMDYLGFEYEGKAYVYQALPFGLATAPCLFTKIMKPVISKLRERYRCGIYLDDGIMMFSTVAEAEAGVQEMLELLGRLGLRISFGKSKLTPVRVLEFLGWEINTERMEVAVTEGKRAEAARRVSAWIRRAKEKKSVRIRDFASVTGLLASMSLVISQAHLQLRLCTKRIEEAAQSQGWDGRMQLGDEVIPALTWWQGKLKERVTMRLRSFTPEIRLTTDASGTGWGADVDGAKWKTKVKGTWDDAMANPKTSSNLRELTAVRMSLERLIQTGRVRAGCDILVRSDNLTTVANINRRSCAVSLLPEMMTLFGILERSQLRVRTTYIPGKENVVADELSRQTDAADYSMEPDVFLSLTEELDVSVGIDLFASAENTKARRFYSWRPSEGALATDALVQSWNGEEDMYAFPPPVLIPKILSKLRQEGGRMMIITPGWAAAAWRRDLEELTVKRRELGEIGEFAARGSLVPQMNNDPVGSWIASLIQV